MTETVSEIIAARAQQPDGLSRLVGWSVLAHVALVVLVAWSSIGLRERMQDPPRTVMTISLGGSAGPRTGGLTAMGGRTVQAPPPETPTRRAETPPARRTEAALPSPRPAPPRPRVERAPQDAVGRTPTTGEEPQEGPARADTRVRGQGFGLTTGGGAGSGVQLDVGNFCCPEYIEQMVRAIRDNWESNQDVAGSVVMRFTITRSGALLGAPLVETPSGFAAHELAAQRALLRARLAPLPTPYPNPTLTVHMRFDYVRR